MMLVAEMNEVRGAVRTTLAKLCDKEPSKAAFGRKVGTTQQNVQNWVNGFSMPPVEKLVEIADVYGLSLDAMVGRGDVPDMLSEEEAEVVGLMRQMDLNGCRMLVTVAKAFVESGSYGS